MLKEYTQCKVSPIAVDADAHEYRAIQLVRDSSGDHVLAWSILPRMNDSVGPQPDKAELQRYHALLSCKGFVGNRYALCAPSHDTDVHIFNNMTVPKTAALDRIAALEIARIDQTQADENRVCAWNTSLSARSNDVIALSCPGSVVDSALDVYEGIDCALVSMDFPTRAIHNVIVSEYDFHDGCIYAVLHIGWDCSYIMIYHGTRIIYIRTIQHGISTLWNQCIEQYSMSFDTAHHCILYGMSDLHISDTFVLMQKLWKNTSIMLVEELDIAVNYVSHAHRSADIGDVHVCGYGCDNIILQQDIDSVVGMPVSNVIPKPLLTALGGLSSTRSFAGRLLPAYGMALRYDS